MCGNRFPDESIQVDHIVPEANGGSHDPLNLQPLCAPKAGAGCHRIKSRWEAKERAQRMKEEAEHPGNPGAVLRAGCAFVAGAVAARCAWLSAMGAPIEPFLEQAHTWLGYGVLGGWALGAVAVLGRVGAWSIPLIEFDPDAPEESHQPSTEQTLKAKLLKIMGEDIRVKPGKDGGHWVHYSDNVDDHDDNARFKIQERVNAKMEGRWRLTWDTEHNKVLMAPRPVLPKMVRHPGAGALAGTAKKPRPWHIIPVADGMAIDLSRTAHALIIGRTNAGKTALIRSAILATIDSAARGEVETNLLDPKQVELIGFEGWPGVTKVVTTEQAMWDLPLELVAEMEERYRLFAQEKIRLSSHTPRIVICDEYEDYVKSMQAMWTAIDPDTGKPRKKPGESEPPPVAAMAKLLRKARKCGIHIIIGTQRPDAKWFGGAARDNCECRIVVGSPSRQALSMAFERTDVGRDIPAELKGRFTMQNLDGDFEEGQSYWVADPADADGKNSDEDWAHLDLLKAALVPSA